MAQTMPALRNKDYFWPLLIRDSCECIQNYIKCLNNYQKYMYIDPWHGVFAQNILY